MVWTKNLGVELLVGYVFYARHGDGGISGRMPVYFQLFRDRTSDCWATIKLLPHLRGYIPLLDCWWTTIKSLSVLPGYRSSNLAR